MEETQDSTGHQAFDSTRVYDAREPDAEIEEENEEDNQSPESPLQSYSGLVNVPLYDTNKKVIPNEQQNGPTVLPPLPKTPKQKPIQRQSFSVDNNSIKTEPDDFITKVLRKLNCCIDVD